MRVLTIVLREKWYKIMYKNLTLLRCFSDNICAFILDDTIFQS